MNTSTKQLIKLNIKDAINSNPNKDLVLKFGMGAKVSFTSKKAFGNKVLEVLERDNIKAIDFQGLEDNALVFDISFTSNDTWGNNRGYGQGRYMAD